MHGVGAKYEAYPPPLQYSRKAEPLKATTSRTVIKGAKNTTKWERSRVRLTNVLHLQLSDIDYHYGPGKGGGATTERFQ